MSDSDIVLLVRLQAQVSTFLAELPADRLVALAEGRASLALLDVGDQATAPITSTRPAASAEYLPAASAVRSPVVGSHASPRARTAATKGVRVVDVDTVIARLRACTTVDEATARLAALSLGVNELKDIARSLGIPVSGRKDDVAKRILSLIVGARSKHAGLRQG
ncbi:hypothetical protein AB0J90_03455 [Micromonospora sp. NPDC049523]|uniref:SAP domain-containing protein n=1 Tax=Micromonospora sp. NPDC049523 TaxID=3155921 RepID=UPI003430E9E7